MGKVRKVQLGDESAEREQKRKAEARRETKKSKKDKVEGVGLHGGERTSMVEGTELKSEVKELLEQVEGGEKAETKKKKKPVGPRYHSKKYKDAYGLVDRTKLYPLKDAIALTKRASYAKFDGTVELHINLNVEMLGGKPEFRGSTTLPHGTGKQVRVIVADDEVLKNIEVGKLDFDILVAKPMMMAKLAKFAKILGPKGLMPNPKNGTVTEDVEKRVKELSHGQINFKTEPNNAIIHLPVGKISFEDIQISENVAAVIAAIGKNKISRMTMSSTMGPGVKIAL